MLPGKHLAGNYYFLCLYIIVVKNMTFGYLYVPHTQVQMLMRCILLNFLMLDCIIYFLFYISINIFSYYYYYLVNTTRKLEN
jgi:hypothetical protein